MGDLEATLEGLAVAPSSWAAREPQPSAAFVSGNVSLYNQTGTGRCAVADS